MMPQTSNNSVNADLGLESRIVFVDPLTSSPDFPACRRETYRAGSIGLPRFHDPPDNREGDKILFMVE